MKFNAVYAPEENDALCEAVIAYAEKDDAFRGHVNPALMRAFHKLSQELAIIMQNQGGDIKKLVETNINLEDKAFHGLCPFGRIYMGEALVHAFEVVSEDAGLSVKPKERSKQIADIAVIDMAQATGVFDPVLRR